MDIQFIHDYPGLIALLVGALWAVILLLGGLGYRSIVARVDKFELEVKEIREIVNAITKNYLTRFDGLGVKLDDTKVTLLDRLHQLEIKLMANRRK